MIQQHLEILKEYGVGIPDITMKTPNSTVSQGIPEITTITPSSIVPPFFSVINSLIELFTIIMFTLSHLSYPRKHSIHSEIGLRLIIPKDCGMF